MQLFIALLLSRVTVVAALAGCHGDRDKDHRPRQNCTAAGFSHVPAGLDSSTKVGGAVVAGPAGTVSGLGLSWF